MASEKKKAPRKALGRAVLAADADLPLAPVSAKPERQPMKISHGMLARAAERPDYRAPTISGEDLFRPYEPAPGVLPAGQTAKMAMDDAGAWPALGWAGNSLGGGFGSSLYQEGQMFMGYSALALMAQRPEYRLVNETLADEATRKWIKFKAVSEEDDKAAKIKAIEAEFDRLDVRGHFRVAAEKDGYFGRHHIYLDTGDTEDGQELATNLGDSYSTVSRSKVSPERPLRALRSVEAMWCYPNFYNAQNPLKKDWYRPSIWYTMGQQIHTSRLLTFVAREVPDILKPAYAFGGLSLTQMIHPYVDNWLRTRQSVQDLITGFSTFVLKTNMAAAYSGAGGDDFFNRADMFNMMRSNRGLFMLDKETEDFANVSAPLSGLDHLKAQAQENIASVAKMPLVKFTGISPSGLNASSEGELRCWEDYIHSYQEAFFDRHLNTILNFVQLSLWGEIDEGITYEWLPLNELTEKEQAELRQINAQTDAILVETGAIDSHEVRAREANDEGSPHAGMDVDDMPEVGGEMGGMEGMLGGEGEHGHEHAMPYPPKPHAISATGNAKSEGGFKPAGDEYPGEGGGGSPAHNYVISDQAPEELAALLNDWAGNSSQADLNFETDKAELEENRVSFDEAPKSKRTRTRKPKPEPKFLPDPPEGSVEAHAGERL